jgi:hypothetical protein
MFVYFEWQNFVIDARILEQNETLLNCWYILSYEDTNKEDTNMHSEHPVPCACVIHVHQLRE